MRPLRLAIRGFTSFRDEQDIDFDGLDLFAIVGPTGSGKSSVLDAMTYALFGDVDRVRGSEISTKELISQGQPRMAVTFDFEVGNDRYRVTRSLPRGGATKVLVERWDDDAWRQAGDGVDRVKPANALLQRLVGLDFDGFTRSVLLPQGKFSAFMSGDAGQRREILTELLGLTLFERMGRRARQVARDAKDRAEWTEESIASRYADATPEALAVAHEVAAEAGKRASSLATAATKVRSVADRWKSVADEARQLASCADEAAELATAAGRHAAGLAEVAQRAARAKDTVREAELASGAASKAAEVAADARAVAEERWGTVAAIAAARERARRLLEVRMEASTRRATVARADADVPLATNAVTSAEGLAAEAREAAASAAAEREAAESGLRTVEHADMVAAVASGLKVGDECPVCGEPLTRLPKRPGAAAVREAERAVQRAREAAERAATLASQADGELLRARDRAAAAERDRDAARVELGRCEREAGELEAALADAFPDALPDDPVAELAERAAELDRLLREEAAAAKSAADAERAAADARGLAERIAADATAERAGLEALAVGAIAERAVRVAPDLSAPELRRLPATSDLPDLARAAAERADALDQFGARLAESASVRAASGEGLLDQARQSVAGQFLDARSLEELSDAVDRAEREAIREHEQRKAEAEAIKRDIKAVADLRREASELRARARLFSDLAKELQADRLIAFLQAEALRLLAVGGSDRLASLSSGRYALAYEGDEFLVVDRWNGDETRSVRTLSGGETFLASLALALALAEQVSSLAVTEHASLDSLFLDEGFGTLDPETLDVVVEAIEQLGGDGRMVGVITHVRDLADRLPARLEVTKSPRGSSISRAS
ncbi:MAG: AAA family ATPase [Actinomycetota bacterium]